MTLGPRLGDGYDDTLIEALSGDLIDGVALEFGVATGHSGRIIGSRMSVVGFDSFEGLPEDWRPGFPAGKFAGRPPDYPGHIVIGLFADTLPRYVFPLVAFVHVDCDLYSSTFTVLEHVGPHLRPGCVIVFDEFHGYPGWEDHEARAWGEFVERTGIEWEPIGHGPEQLAVRILSV